MPISRIGKAGSSAPESHSGSSGSRQKSTEPSQHARLSALSQEPAPRPVSPDSRDVVERMRKHTWSFEEITAKLNFERRAYIDFGLPPVYPRKRRYVQDTSDYSIADIRAALHPEFVADGDGKMRLQCKDQPRTYAFTKEIFLAVTHRVQECASLNPAQRPTLNELSAQLRLDTNIVRMVLRYTKLMYVVPHTYEYEKDRANEQRGRIAAFRPSQNGLMEILTTGKRGQKLSGGWLSPTQYANLVKVAGSNISRDPAERLTTAAIAKEVGITTTLAGAAMHALNLSYPYVPRPADVELANGQR